MPGDVEDFLRKLIEKQLGQGGAQRPQQPQAARPAPPQPARPQPQRPSQPQRRPPPQQARRPVPQVLDAEIIEDEVEIVEAEPVTGDDVAYHVAKHLDAREFEARSGQLGAGVRQEEAELQSHIKQAIGGGPKGRLTRSTPSTSDVSATPPATEVARGSAASPNIADLIRSPQDFRRAFILSEVLKRPDFDNLFG